VLQRLNKLFKRKSNGEFDSEVDAAQMIRLAVSEMEFSIKKTNETLIKAEENIEKLQEQAELYRKEANTWNERAVIAVKSGQEGFGRKALDEKKAAESQKEKYANLAADSYKTANELKMQLQKMDAQLVALKAEESLLTGVAQAETNTTIENIKKSIADTIPEIVEVLPPKNTANEPNFDAFEIFKQKVKEEEVQKTNVEAELTYQKIMQIWGNQADEQEKVQEALDEKTRLLNEFLANDISERQKMIDDFLGENPISEKQKQIDTFFNRN